MGIYPVVTTKDHKRWPDGSETWIEVESTPGVVKESYVVKHKPIVTRTDCFCCSCGDREGSDVFCRNHGRYGSRPCEQHGMPGSPDEDGEVPESVQAERERARRAEARVAGS